MHAFQTLCNYCAGYTILLWPSALLGMLVLHATSICTVSELHVLTQRVCLPCALAIVSSDTSLQGTMSCINTWVWRCSHVLMLMLNAV